MSKLQDLFKRAAARSPQPLGFGAAKDAVGAGILLFGHARSPDISKTPRLAKADVDAIILDSGGKPVSKAAASALEDTIWGSEHDQFGAEAVQDLKDQGCDFLVFDAGETSESAINDDDLASFLRVSGELDRVTAAAVNLLGVTGLALVDTLQDEELTVQKMIDIAKLNAMVDSPLVLLGSRVFSPSELGALRNAGVSALVLPLGDEDAIEQSRANLREVGPNRGRLRSSAWTALAPSSADE